MPMGRWRKGAFGHAFTAENSRFVRTYEGARGGWGGGGEGCKLPLQQFTISGLSRVLVRATEMKLFSGTRAAACSKRFN